MKSGRIILKEIFYFFVTILGHRYRISRVGCDLNFDPFRKKEKYKNMCNEDHPHNGEKDACKKKSTDLI